MDISKSNVQSPKPYRMQYHMKNIVPFRRRINHKMFPHLNPSSLHLYIMPLRNTQQNFLQIWYILHRNYNRKCLPIQNITEWNHIIILNKHWNTAHVKTLHHSWTRHFISTGANAISAFSNYPIIGYILWKVFVYLNIWIFVFPVFQENWSNGAVNSAGVENEYRTFRRRWTAEHAVDCAGWKEDFWDGNVSDCVKSF